MTHATQNAAYTFLGTTKDDTIANGFIGIDGTQLSTLTEDIVKANGRDGDDTITTGDGNNLAAGDMVGNEWVLVDGAWVYVPSALVQSAYGLNASYDDMIRTGNGHDVLLGNGGNDTLEAGAGNDTINAGTGDDHAFGGHGSDVINLEDGDDFAQAGYGHDIVNGGAGNDLIFGDVKGSNLLAQPKAKAVTFADLAASDAWTITDSDGNATISQSAATVAGETYTISFDLAANLAGGYASGKVEVLWNGEVVETVETKSGVYETFEVEVTSTGENGDLSFRALQPEADNTYTFDGPIISYEKTMSVNGVDVTVAAFAPGQAKLYQAIDGQLNVFDVAAKEYVAVGEKPNFKTNSIGFNVEDDMIYGIAKSNGTDSLGNQVQSTDIVMIDAEGATYRVGGGYYGDYVGDLDDAGNLWTFHSGLNRISVVDVDQIDPNGNNVIKHYKFPADMFADRTYDIAYNGADDAFYAVVSPGQNGGDGKVLKIDLSAVLTGGKPTFSEVAITGTLYGDTMQDGMAKGAYGAVFMDGEGNLYYGLNRGDHDLDVSTQAQGAIFKVNVDWETGQAYSEFMSEAAATGSNDGAVDPRSTDAFAEIDADAAVLIREPVLTLTEGGNDTLRGGEGDDEIHGNEGDDDLNGGAGNDVIFGDEGADKVSSGSGDDIVSGGTGADKLRGEAGDDALSGEEGDDFLDGGADHDQLYGGAGVDKVVGGTGADILNGGTQNDHLWGGAWTGDDAQDTFVFASGTGKDYVHDFEVSVDLIDLSDFSTTFETLQGTMSDLGWATVIDLQQLDAGQTGDRIVLKSVQEETLTAEDFIF